MRTGPAPRTPAFGTSAEDAYRQLRGLLTAGRFRPGERLREEHLSTALGVSRTPVREALRRLQSDGLVVSGARGAAVAELSPAQTQALYRFRAPLESLSARLAAERNAAGEVSASTLRRLTCLRDEVERSAAEADARAVAQANLALHRYVAELSDNEFVVDALARVWDRIAIATQTNVTDRAWSETMHRHHRDLVDAIVAGDGARAAALAGEHVQQAALVHRSSTEGDR